MKYCTKTIIKKFEEIHTNNYNYELVNYINITDKLSIVCTKCKNIFFQSSEKHLKGQGCPNRCFKKDTKKDKNLVLNQFKEIHR